MTDATRSQPEAATERVIGTHTRGQPGPTLICICGLHGNEPAGAEAALRVLAELERDDPDEFFGRLVAITGNIAAGSSADKPSRYIDHDLNRSFTPERVAEARALPDAQRSVEQREVVELLDALEAEFATADGQVFVLDLHTFSSRGYPFGVIEDSLAARHFARRFPIPVVLGMEEELDGLLMDYIGRTYAHVAMIFEGGTHQDARSVLSHAGAVRVALQTVGIMPYADVEGALRVLARGAGIRSGRFYDVRHCEPIRDPSFEMIEGIESAEPVRRGLLVATESGRPRRTPIRGVMFLPNRNPGRRPGDDAYFIIRHVDRLSLWLSDKLRRRQMIHRILPTLMPGVRRIPGDPDRLLVAPEIAAVFKREVFHLLGYRIERHGEVVHRAAIVRVWLGLNAAARSVAKLVAGAFRGGERAALPTERHEDWIVTRRTLDIRDIKRASTR